MNWVGLALLALAGFFLGGVVTTWRSARALAVVLVIATTLATAAGIAWLV